MANTPSDNKLKKYIHIGIVHRANNYYRKKVTDSTRFILTNSGNIQNLKQNSYYIDTPFNLDNDYVNHLNLEEYFDNELLVNAIMQLSHKEKKFLLEKFIFDKGDTELAKERNSSQQAVSIYKKRLLKKIKELMKR
ncbi:hypothetical protein [Vagococcus fluvialis]|uniref:hypothetical protein n=1 Tax=Vagococcus fluvialis TaxID=2738 RepID=UPI0037B65FFE